MSDTDVLPERRPRVTVATLMIGVFVLAVAGTLAIPNLLEARKHGNETAAIGALKTICTAEALFREGDKDLDGLLDYGTLTELSATQLVDGVLGAGTKRGYLFQAAPSVTTADFLWFAVANPEAPRSTGDRSFATNHTGVIVHTTDGPLALDTSDCDFPAALRPRFCDH